VTGSRGQSVWRSRAHVLLAAHVLTLANAGKPIGRDADTASGAR